MNRRGFLALVAGGLAGAATRGPWPADDGVALGSMAHPMDLTEEALEELLADGPHLVFRPTLLVIPEQQREIAMAILSDAFPDDDAVETVELELVDPDAWFLAE